MVRKRLTWFAVREVPRELRGAVGKARLTRTLGTHDVAVARSRRHAALAAMELELDTARRAASIQHPASVSAALQQREALREAEADPERWEEAQVLRDLIHESRERARGSREAEERNTAAAIALGTATPLTLHLETWLMEGGVKGSLAVRTKIEHRKAVNDLATWLGKERHGATVEAVTRQVAGRYVSSSLLPSGRHPRTVGKAVHTLSSYWKWLRQRGHADDAGRIPWEGQAPRAPGLDSTQEGAERAFTTAEMLALLAAPPEGPLGDFMRIAALSGMRREEIGRLTVADCADGLFVVRKGKTDASRRRVPIHPDLAGIVTARSRGKSPGAFLFELEAAGDERTDPLGKLFMRYRRGLKIQDGEGRRSTVNFHSFRRWFITEAINAGQPPHVVSLAVGHKEGRRSVTLTAYWRGAEDSALRACVEAVKLPNPRQ